MFFVCDSYVSTSRSWVDPQEVVRVLGIVKIVVTRVGTAFLELPEGVLI